jgi:hypothetical protein
MQENPKAVAAFLRAYNHGLKENDRQSGSGD